MFVDRRFQFKKKHLRELANIPDDKVSVRQFCNIRVSHLKMKLNDPNTNSQEAKAILDVIDIYKKAMK